VKVCGPFTAAERARAGRVKKGRRLINIMVDIVMVDGGERRARGELHVISTSTYLST
jgi:hypothetical protein